MGVSTPPFVPSSWKLNAMILSAMARFDADRDQALRAKDATTDPPIRPAKRRMEEQS